AGIIDETIDGLTDFIVSISGRNFGRTCNFLDEFTRPVLEHFSGAIENLAPKIRAFFRPTLKRCTGGDDSVAKIFARSVTEVIELSTASGFGGKVTAAFAADKISADVELVSFSDVEP